MSTAVARLNAVADEIKARFVERDEVIDLIKYSLIGQDSKAASEENAHHSITPLPHCLAQRYALLTVTSV